MGVFVIGKQTFRTGSDKPEDDKRSDDEIIEEAIEASKRVGDLRTLHRNTEKYSKRLGIELPPNSGLSELFDEVETRLKEASEAQATPPEGKKKGDQPAGGGAGDELAREREKHAEERARWEAEKKAEEEKRFKQNVFNDVLQACLGAGLDKSEVGDWKSVFENRFDIRRDESGKPKFYNLDGEPLYNEKQALYSIDDVAGHLKRDKPKAFSTPKGGLGTGGGDNTTGTGAAGGGGTRADFASMSKEERRKLSASELFAMKGNQQQ